MGLFDFVGTFFFLSLGITFVLILLLVYHFKQRLSDMEQKSDKMFEIVNTIVKEMGNMRRAISQYSQEVSVNDMTPPPYTPTYEREHDNEEEDTAEDICEEYEEVSNLPNTNTHAIVYNIGDAITPRVLSGDVMNDFFHINANTNTNTQDNEEYDDNTPQQVKVVSVDLTYNEDDVNTDDEESTVLSDLDDPEENPVVVVSSSGEEVVHVNKLDETMPTSEEVDSEVVPTEQPIPYTKMNLTQLRAYAVSRGLLSDSSKMKKAELIKLLESNDE